MQHVLADVFSHPEELLNQLRDLAPAIFWSLVIIVLTYVVSCLLSGRTRAALQRGGFQVNVATLLARTLWICLWIIGLVLILYQFGIGLTPLTALVGVIGLAASLSLQAVLQNLVAGVYLLAERPFQIGDFIAVIGPAGLNHEGRVEDIQMRTTRLRNEDDELILVPNSSIFSGVITNRTAVGSSVRHVSITFPRDIGIESARRSIASALADIPAVLQTPAPRLRVDSVAAETWTGSLSLWTSTPDAESDVIWAVAGAVPSATVNQAAAV